MFGNFKPFNLSFTMGNVSGNIPVIGGQVRNLIGFCVGNHLHMISKSKENGIRIVLRKCTRQQFLHLRMGG